MVSLPLLTPQTFLWPSHQRCSAKRGLRGLDSGRLSAHVKLRCPEFTLRGLPRITVRGQPVQSVRSSLRTAPLRSSAVPWSTERICGPLAFSRATEGRRGLKGRLGGVKRGIRNHLVSYPPLAPAGGHRRALQRLKIYPLRFLSRYPCKISVAATASTFSRCFFSFFPARCRISCAATVVRRSSQSCTVSPVRSSSTLASA